MAGKKGKGQTETATSPFSLFKPTSWSRGAPKPKQAKLGEENNMYYSQELKRWVERGKEEEAAREAAGPPPPPMASGESFSSTAPLGKRSLSQRYVLQKNLSVSSSMASLTGSLSQTDLAAMQGTTPPDIGRGSHTGSFTAGQPPGSCGLSPSASMTAFPPSGPPSSASGLPAAFFVPAPPRSAPLPQIPGGGFFVPSVPPSVPEDEKEHSEDAAPADDDANPPQDASNAQPAHHPFANGQASSTTDHQQQHHQEAAEEQHPSSDAAVEGRPVSGDGELSLGASFPTQPPHTPAPEQQQHSRHPDHQDASETDAEGLVPPLVICASPLELPSQSGAAVMLPPAGVTRSAPSVLIPSAQSPEPAAEASYGGYSLSLADPSRQDSLVLSPVAELRGRPQQQLSAHESSSTTNPYGYSYTDTQQQAQEQEPEQRQEGWEGQSPRALVDAEIINAVRCIREEREPAGVSDGGAAVSLYDGLGDGGGGGGDWGMQEPSPDAEGAGGVTLAPADDRPAEAEAAAEGSGPMEASGDGAAGEVLAEGGVAEGHGAAGVECGPEAAAAAVDGASSTYSQYYYQQYAYLYQYALQQGYGEADAVSYAQYYAASYAAQYEQQAPDGKLGGSEAEGAATGEAEAAAGVAGGEATFAGMMVAVEGGGEGDTGAAPDAATDGAGMGAGMAVDDDPEGNGLAAAEDAADPGPAPEPEPVYFISAPAAPPPHANAATAPPPAGQDDPIPPLSANDATATDGAPLVFDAAPLPADLTAAAEDAAARARPHRVSLTTFAVAATVADATSPTAEVIPDSSSSLPAPTPSPPSGLLGLGAGRLVALSSAVASLGASVSAAVALSASSALPAPGSPTAPLSEDAWERIMHPGDPAKLDGPLPWELPEGLRHAEGRRLMALCANWHRDNPGTPYAPHLLLQDSEELQPQQGREADAPAGADNARGDVALAAEGGDLTSVAGSHVVAASTGISPAELADARAGDASAALSSYERACSLAEFGKPAEGLLGRLGPRLVSLGTVEAEEPQEQEVQLPGQQQQRQVAEQLAQPAGPAAASDVAVAEQGASEEAEVETEVPPAALQLPAEESSSGQAACEPDPEEAAVSAAAFQEEEASAAAAAASGWGEADDVDELVALAELQHEQQQQQHVASHPAEAAAAPDSPLHEQAETSEAAAHVQAPMDLSARMNSEQAVAFFDHLGEETQSQPEDQEQQQQQHIEEPELQQQQLAQEQEPELQLEQQPAAVSLEAPPQPDTHTEATPSAVADEPPAAPASAATAAAAIDAVVAALERLRVMAAAGDASLPASPSQQQPEQEDATTPSSSPPRPAAAQAVLLAIQSSLAEATQALAGMGVDVGALAQLAAAQQQPCTPPVAAGAKGAKEDSPNTPTRLVGAGVGGGSSSEVVTPLLPPGPAGNAAAMRGVGLAEEDASGAAAGGTPSGAAAPGERFQQLAMQLSDASNAGPEEAADAGEVLPASTAGAGDSEPVPAESAGEVEARVREELSVDFEARLAAVVDSEREAASLVIASVEAERDGLAARLGAAEGALAAAETERRALAEQLAAVTAARGEVEAAAAAACEEREHLSERLEAWEARCEAVQLQLAEAEADKGALAAQLAGAEAEREALAEALAVERTEKAGLAEALAASRGEVEELRRSYAARFAGLEAELEATRGSLEELRAEHDELLLCLGQESTKVGLLADALREVGCDPQPMIEQVEAEYETMGLGAAGSEDGDGEDGEQGEETEGAGSGELQQGGGWEGVAEGVEMAAADVSTTEAPAATEPDSAVAILELGLGAGSCGGWEGADIVLELPVAVEAGVAVEVCAAAEEAQLEQHPPSAAPESDDAAGAGPAHEQLAEGAQAGPDFAPPHVPATELPASEAEAAEATASSSPATSEGWEVLLQQQQPAEHQAVVPTPAAQDQDQQQQEYAVAADAAAILFPPTDAVMDEVDAVLAAVIDAATAIATPAAGGALLAPGLPEAQPVESVPAPQVADAGESPGPASYPQRDGVSQGGVSQDGVSQGGVSQGGADSSSGVEVEDAAVLEQQQWQEDEAAAAAVAIEAVMLGDGWNGEDLVGFVEGGEVVVEGQGTGEGEEVVLQEGWGGEDVLCLVPDEGTGEVVAEAGGVQQEQGQGSSAVVVEDGSGWQHVADGWMGFGEQEQQSTGAEAGQGQLEAVGDLGAALEGGEGWDGEELVLDEGLV